MNHMHIGTRLCVRALWGNLWGYRPVNAHILMCSFQICVSQIALFPQGLVFRRQAISGPLSDAFPMGAFNNELCLQQPGAISPNTHAWHDVQSTHAKCRVAFLFKLLRRWPKHAYFLLFDDQRLHHLHTLVTTTLLSIQNMQLDVQGELQPVTAVGAMTQTCMFFYNLALRSQALSPCCPLSHPQFHWDV